MPKHIYINKKISTYDKIIQVSSDKSLSIRTILLASQAVGISKISNILESEDVLNTLKIIKDSQARTVYFGDEFKIN